MAAFSSEWLRASESVENCDWHSRYQSGWSDTSRHGLRNISVVVLGGRSFDRLAGDSEGRGGWGGAEY